MKLHPDSLRPNLDRKNVGLSNRRGHFVLHHVAPRQNIFPSYIWSRNRRLSRVLAMSRFLHALSLLFTFASLNVLAQHSSNGMDPAMDMPMNLASGRMLPYLHFTPGDILWFEGWVPGRSTTLFGTCVGLFVLALLHRWVVALRAALEFSIATSKFVFQFFWVVGWLTLFLF
jgi:hypothetical protein